jgi:hypothetical protein
MKKILIIIFCFGLLIMQSCKKNTLEVQNLNLPSLDALNSEAGVISYSKGFYKIGFGDQPVSSLDDGLGWGMMLIVLGAHEAMGDNIFIPWGNNNYKYMDGPLWVKLDNGTTIPNPIGQGQPFEMKLRNDRAFNATNGFLPEWTYMYFLNNSANVLLSKVDATTFSGDAAAKKNVLKAWAYWWKGYAYCRIGSMYIAGLIAETPNSTNGSFVTNTAMVAEGIKNLDKALALLTPMSAAGGYTEVMSQVIPAFLQVPGLMSPAQWVKNINTFKARSILVNKKVSAMTSADWTSIKTLVDAGIGASDYEFQARTFPDNSKSIFDKDFGTAHSYTATNDPTYFVSERLIQDYNPGDKRMTNNFSLLPSAVVNKRGRSITFGTRYFLKDGGNGNGAYTYFHFDYGVDKYYLAGSYEENELMKAECLIQLGSIDAGVTIINNIRTLQGAGFTSPMGLSKAAALEELRKERRCALFLRGLAFYDARRLGITDDVSKGGGRPNSVVLDGGGLVNTKALINYNYMPYWDVPQNELDFNAPLTGSAPVKAPL